MNIIRFFCVLERNGGLNVVCTANSPGFLRSPAATSSKQQVRDLPTSSSQPIMSSRVQPPVRGMKRPALSQNVAGQQTVSSLPSNMYLVNTSAASPAVSRHNLQASRRGKYLTCKVSHFVLRCFLTVVPGPPVGFLHYPQQMAQPTVMPVTTMIPAMVTNCKSVSSSHISIHQSQTTSGLPQNVNLINTLPSPVLSRHDSQSSSGGKYFFIVSFQVTREAKPQHPIQVNFVFF